MSPAFRGAVTAQMRELGWREIQDYVIVVPTGFKYDLASVKQNVAGALNEKLDLLVVGSTAGALEAHRLTKTLPIVMHISGYPVEAGVANSLAHPGKNVTGNSIYAGTGIWGKLLELLRDAKPGIRRIGILWGYVPPFFPAAEIEPCYAEFRKSASALGLAIHIVEVRAHENLPSALAAIAAERPDALFISGWLTLGDGWASVVQFAAERKLPIVSDLNLPLDDRRLRPLMTYTADTTDLLLRTIGYVDRILKGANPGELPIQLPSKFDLIVDQRMAKTIGLKVPQLVLLRANRVIE